MISHLPKLSPAKYGIVLLASFMFGQPVLASLDSQIQQLEGQKAQQQQQLNATKDQLNTLQGRLNELNAQVADLENKIYNLQIQIDRTQTDIDTKEAELARQKAQLGELIRDNYEQQQTSVLEMLATSNTLSDFFDKEQYSESIQGKIHDASVAVLSAKKALEDQKAALGQQKIDIQGQKTLVDQAQAAQAQLVEATQGQEANYQALLNGTTSQLSGLYAQRAALLAGSGSHLYDTGGAGGYPSVWANAPQDSMVDDWYYYNRECVSYAAFRRAQIGKPTPGYGNAANWPVNSQSPTVGSVAVWGYNVGPYGHVAYVESVGGGTITVAQYNWDGAGHFSRMSIAQGSSLWPSKGFLN